MSLKISHALLGTIILLFLVSGYTVFINQAEDSTGLSAGILGSGLSALNSNISGVSDGIGDYTDKVDDSSTMSIEDDQLLESRGSDTGSMVNVLSKNVLIRFFNALAEQIPSASFVIKYALLFVGSLLSVLVIRFIWGDNRS